MRTGDWSQNVSGAGSFPVSPAQLTLGTGGSWTNSWGVHCMGFIWVTEFCASAGSLSTIPEAMETCSGMTRWSLHGKQSPPCLEKLGRVLVNQPTRSSWHHQTSSVSSTLHSWCMDSRVRSWAPQASREMKKQLVFLASCQDGKQMESLYCGFLCLWQADVVTFSRAGWRNVPSSPTAGQAPHQQKEN